MPAKARQRPRRQTPATAYWRHPDTRSGDVTGVAGFAVSSAYTGSDQPSVVRQSAHTHERPSGGVVVEGWRGPEQPPGPLQRLNDAAGRRSR
jgi:hypothetical protein